MMTNHGNDNDNNDGIGKKHETYLLESIHLAMENVRRRKTWPFGAVIARGGEVIAKAVNEVEALCDPSAHAEMQAVRAAAKALGTTDLRGCTVYASGYPCPMCLTAMYLAGVKSVYFAYSNEDGEPYDLSAAKGYLEIARPLPEREMPLVGLPVRAEGEDLYEAWRKIAAGPHL
jgi:tRNA(Arg) A34 adenosine deaminase TadA